MSLIEIKKTPARTNKIPMVALFWGAVLMQLGLSRNSFSTIVMWIFCV
jgi:hypothetical protein